MEAPARSNTLFIIDDAEGLLMLFQVVQEGLGRQRLFQIVLAPAFIDIVRSCIHKRLSEVWKWEILTIASAEEREIS